MRCSGWRNMGAMIQLLRKSIDLLRWNPILWMPYLVAQLLAIGLWKIWGILRTDIFQWFTTSHSVLGGTVPDMDHSALASASLVAIPIGLATVFAIVCFFVCALMTTAGIVEAISQEQKVDVRQILVGLVPRWRRGLLFSVVVLLVSGACLAVVVASDFFILYFLHGPDYLQYRPDLSAASISTFGFTTLWMGCTGWLLMPMAIRLLRLDRTVQVSSRTRNLGTAVVVLVAVAGVALGLILHRAERPIFLDTQWEFTALGIFNSIVANAPDALLFVALALLAREHSEAVGNGQGILFGRFKKTLMPLHFPEEKDPE